MSVQRNRYMLKSVKTVLTQTWCSNKVLLLFQKPLSPGRLRYKVLKRVAIHSWAKELLNNHGVLLQRSKMASRSIPYPIHKSPSTNRNKRIFKTTHNRLHIFHHRPKRPRAFLTILNNKKTKYRRRRPRPWWQQRQLPQR